MIYQYMLTDTALMIWNGEATLFIARSDPRYQEALIALEEDPYHQNWDTLMLKINSNDLPGLPDYSLPD